jgi:hypothetical protein
MGPRKDPRYTSYFHPKGPGKQIPSRFPNGAPMEIDILLQGHFYIFLYFKGLMKRGPYGNRRTYLLHGAEEFLKS